MLTQKWKIAHGPARDKTAKSSHFRLSASLPFYARPPDLQEKQPNEKVFGWDTPWTSNRISGRASRAKSFLSIAARGVERKGRNPAQGSRGFGASSRGCRKPGPPRVLFRAPERLDLRAPLFRGLRGVRCQRSGKTRWGHSEAPKRPHFPGCPLEGVPTLGLLPSGHR